MGLSRSQAIWSFFRWKHLIKKMTTGMWKFKKLFQFSFFFSREKYPKKSDQNHCFFLDEKQFPCYVCAKNKQFEESPEVR